MLITCGYGKHDLNAYTNYFILDEFLNNKACTNLVPRGAFLTVWRNNIGIIDDDTNNKYYIEEYYKEVLSKLDVYKLYEELDNSILFSYGDNNDFSIRHIIAEWFQILLGIRVPEIKICNNNIVELNRSKFIRECLEEIIRKNINMRFYKFIQAAYLYEQGSSLYKLAKLLNSNEECIIHACNLVCKADDIEFNYMKDNFDKINSLTKKKH